jgi:hypothetical protein
MANDVTESGEGIHEVANTETAAILDNAAPLYLGMSGEEFLRAWAEGKFRNCACADPGVAWVPMLIPLAEPR